MYMYTYQWGVPVAMETLPLSRRNMRDKLIGENLLRKGERRGEGERGNNDNYEK